MWIKIATIGGGILGTAILALLGVDIHENRKIGKKLDMSAKELKESTSKEISVAMLENAVDKAAKETTGTFIRAIKDSISKDAREQLNAEAKKAVKEAQDQIHAEVAEKVSSEVAKIDIDELRKSARNRAEDAILKKLDGELNDKIEQFDEKLKELARKSNEKLNTQLEIFNSLDETLGKWRDKDKGLKVSFG